MKPSTITFLLIVFFCAGIAQGVIWSYLDAHKEDIPDFMRWLNCISLLVTIYTISAFGACFTCTGIRETFFK